MVRYGINTAMNHILRLNMWTRTCGDAGWMKAGGPYEKWEAERRNATIWTPRHALHDAGGKETMTVGAMPTRRHKSVGVMLTASPQSYVTQTS